jgi:alginate O-acetyltransferase complex protein AlgI
LIARRRLVTTAPEKPEATPVLFPSLLFLSFFLPLCLAAYFAAPGIAAKNLILLVFSLLFYAWGEPVFVLVMLGSIGFNYLAARVIDGQAGVRRRWALGVAIAVNLAALALFKYAGFLARSLDVLGGPLGVRIAAPAIALPLGISFFTFHCMSYLIDVYRGRFAANRRLREIALYIALFPQLIAGPIVRYKSIARQLRARRHSLGRASAGMRMFVIGLAQKVLIADELAGLADALFDHTRRPNLGEAWLGILAYTLQIYFDFAGYSSMAVGLGLVFGFALPRNFDRPYQSRSITEFWRRWHITLSGWFRDYLYIPLGGNRGSPAQTYRNLIVVFLLCGLWHGASWTFVLWGAYHGAFLVAERAGLTRLFSGRRAILGWPYALVVVMAGWVLFRAPNLPAALEVWRGMAGLNGLGRLGPALAPAVGAGHRFLLPLAFALAVVSFGKRGQARPKWTRLGAPVLAPSLDVVAMLALLALSLLSISGRSYIPFLYFRF